MSQVDRESITATLFSSLEELYGSDLAEQMTSILVDFANEYHQKNLFSMRRPELSERDVMVSAFGNQIMAQRTPGLTVLHRFLRKHIGYRISLLHLMPFHPAADEDGHAVISHDQVRLDLGDWDDVKALADDFQLMFDGNISHVSTQNAYFVSYSQGSPDYKDYFLEVPEGVDLSSVQHDHTANVLVDAEVDGQAVKVWSTYGEGCVDLNFANPNVLMEIVELLLSLADRGATVIRLRGLHYIWKEPGESCVAMPKTLTILRVIRAVFALASPQTLLAVDIGTEPESAAKYTGPDGAQLISNSGLPAMLLYCVIHGDAPKLSSWLSDLPELPDKAIWVNTAGKNERLDLRPVESALSDDARRYLCRTVAKRMGRHQMRGDAAATGIPRDLIVHYFDAVNDPDADEPLDDQIARYMLTQALPMSLKGIPSVYLHSLLGARKEGESITQIGHMGTMHFSHAIMHEAQLERALSDVRSLRYRVFEEFLRLLEVRGGCSAFHPHADQEIMRISDAAVCVKRHNPQTGDTVIAVHNFKPKWSVLAAQDLSDDGQMMDLIDGAQFTVEEGSMIPLTPYQVRWLKLFA